MSLPVKSYGFYFDSEVLPTLGEGYYLGMGHGSSSLETVAAQFILPSQRKPAGLGPFPLFNLSTSVGPLFLLQSD